MAVWIFERVYNYRGRKVELKKKRKTEREERRGEERERKNKEKEGGGVRVVLVSLVFEINLVWSVCWLCLLGWPGLPGVRGLCRRLRIQLLPLLSFLQLKLPFRKTHLSLTLAHRVHTHWPVSRFGHTWTSIYTSFLWDLISSLLSPGIGYIQKLWSPQLGCLFLFPFLGLYSSIGVMFQLLRMSARLPGSWFLLWLV